MMGGSYENETYIDVIGACFFDAGLRRRDESSGVSR
jgi:hypothetical protein